MKNKMMHFNFIIKKKKKYIHIKSKLTGRMEEMMTTVGSV